MDEMLFVQKMAEYPDKSAKLRDGRSKSCTTNSPMENEDEQGRQAKVHPDGEHAAVHGFLGIAGGTHHVVQTIKITAEQAAAQHNLHEIPGVWQRFRTGAECRQD